MKLHLSRDPHLKLFTGYGDGYVSVNGQRYEASLIVCPDRVLDAWAPRSFDALAEAHFAGLAALKTEIVLLGTGNVLRFPHPRLTQALALARIGFEVMDTYAAARTYNILVAEGRKVAAALIL